MMYTLTDMLTGHEYHSEDIDDFEHVMPTIFDNVKRLVSNQSSWVDDLGFYKIVEHNGRRSGDR